LIESPAVMEAWYPGIAGGQGGSRNLLFGKVVSLRQAARYVRENQRTICLIDASFGITCAQAIDSAPLHWMPDDAKRPSFCR